MKFVALLLLATSVPSVHGFVVSSSSTCTSTSTSKLDAFVPRLNNNLDAPTQAVRTTPVIEDKSAPLTGLSKKYRAKDGSIIMGHDFRLTMEIATVAPLIYYLHSGDMDGQLGALFHVVLAAWIGVQANRVRAVFDKDAIEFYNKIGEGVSYKAKPAKCDPRLQHKPNNWMVASTPNRWNYKDITGYYFYPSLEFPVVTILWEMQTTPGYEQPHFFPALFNAKHFKEEMDLHNVPYKLPSLVLYDTTAVSKK